MYRYRGDAKFRKGQLEESLIDLNKAIDLDPKNSAAYRFVQSLKVVVLSCKQCL